MNTDREDFERGAIAKGWSIAPKQSQLRGIHTPHQYHMPGVEMAWQGFQLARQTGHSTAYLDLLQEVLDAKEKMLTAGVPQGSFPEMLDALLALAGSVPAPCTNEDSWNCKYCNKAPTCEALKDPRNFGVPRNV